MVGVRAADELQLVDADLARRELDRLAAPGNVVGALALHLDRRILRRDLLDQADELRQRRADLVVGRPLLAGGGDRAGGVVGVARLAEAQRELVGLARVHDVGHGLGRLAHGDRQHAGGQRIERAAMADLLRLGQALDHADDMGRGHAGGLVDHQPAVDRAPGGLTARHRSRPPAAARGRCALVQQRADARRIGERLVGHEAQPRRVFEMHLPGEPAAQIVRRPAAAPPPSPGSARRRARS